MSAAPALSRLSTLFYLRPRLLLASARPRQADDHRPVMLGHADRGDALAVPQLSLRGGDIAGRRQHGIAGHRTIRSHPNTDSNPYTNEFNELSARSQRRFCG